MKPRLVFELILVGLVLISVGTCDYQRGANDERLRAKEEELRVARADADSAERAKAHTDSIAALLLAEASERVDSALAVAVEAGEAVPDTVEVVVRDAGADSALVRASIERVDTLRRTQIAALYVTVSDLQLQLAVKDGQIRARDEELKAKDEVIARFEEAFALQAKNRPRGDGSWKWKLAAAVGVGLGWEIRDRLDPG